MLHFRLIGIIAGAVGSLQELYLTKTELGRATNGGFDGYYPSVHLTYNVTADAKYADVAVPIAVKITGHRSVGREGRHGSAAETERAFRGEASDDVAARLVAIVENAFAVEHRGIQQRSWCACQRAYVRDLR